MQEPLHLNNLNTPQKTAVLHKDGPLLILAGAGSGKTRVIVCRIANLITLGVKPWNILAVTFTNKAAAEMRERVNNLVPGQGSAVWVSTFHAFCAKFLRIEAKNIGLDPNYVIYDDSDQLSVIKEVLKEMILSDKEFPPSQIVNTISRAKDELLDAGSFAIHAQTHGDPFRERVGRIYEAYQKKMRAANALDFGDLIMKTVEAFRDVPHIREKYQRRFQYIMVDEYQDTNHAQYLLVKYLTGALKNLCVVGDDDQSIYSWRGATIRNILEFERDYPGAVVVKLEQNYRSSRKIIETSARLIAHNEKRKNKTLWTDNEPGEDIEFVEMMNEQEEARFVVDEIQRLLRGQVRTSDISKTNSNVQCPDLTPADISVFYRTNAQSRVFEDALRRHTIPYTIVGALRFYERAEIKDAMAYLRVTVNAKDSLAVKRVVNLPARGLGKNSLGLIEQYAASQGISLYEALQKAHAISGLSNAARNGVTQFVELIGKFQQYSQQFPASTVVRRVLEESGYWDKWASEAEDDPEAAERLDNLQELINAAKDFEERPIDTTAGEVEEGTNSLARYLQEISLLSDLDEWTDKGGAITLMTVHLAKGLEFPAVFVTGLEEGLFPIGDSAFDQEELEEERRLAYVAITRAKKKLYLTCAASRRIFGTPRLNIPSRFIEEAGIKSSTPNVKTLDSGFRRNDEHYSQVSEYADDFNQETREGTPPGTLQGASRPGVTGGVPSREMTLKVGQLVEHPDWGKGRVEAQEGSGQNAKVTIRFLETGSVKKLLLKYAPIKII